MVALQTDAFEIAVCVFAGCIVMARHRPQAFIDILLTKVSIPPDGAIAREPADLVDALSLVSTRSGLAFVDLFVTVYALVAWTALTVVASNEVSASSVKTRIWSAVIRVCFAVDSFVSLRTGAHIRVLCFTACSSILTWPLQTFVNVLSTGCALISRRADALILVLLVNAGGSVLARIVFALVDVPLTLPASKAGLAEAGVAVHLVVTGSSVLTFNALSKLLLSNIHFKPPTHLAIVDVIRTELPFKASSTDARAVPDPVHTRSSIFTIDPHTVVHVDFAAFAGETKRARAMVSSNLECRDQ